ncbi:T9SS sorting signal type C domain-containing protein [Flavobacterium sp. Arc2]|jgi:uncharacterized delta-60 repeat protein|uniref:T9SS sorting signal type C domain-containing protein n=1 Tax=Flavobacterium sp. Arc2 TaxID=3046685 RepID=UPI00352C28E6
MNAKLRCYLLLICLLFSGSIMAQQGMLDTTFNTADDGFQGDGFDNTVRAVALQPDGDLIVGGEYLYFNGISLPYLTRLKPDGTVDASFNLGSSVDGKVYSTLLQDNGKIIIGGSFTHFNGTAVGRLVRLNSNGSLDTSFNTGLGFTSSIVYATAQQADGKIIVVGSFTKFNTTTTNRVARLLADGSLDPTFTIGSGAGGLVNELKVQADGKIIVVGWFTTFNGLPYNKIVRLNANGSIDTSFATGSGFDENVTALAIQADGKILVGGVFTMYNGITANRIVRLNVDGSLDATFASGTGFSDNGVNVIKVVSNGDIMVGGSFSKKYNGTDVNRLVLLDSNGMIVPGFDIGSGPSSAAVYAIENAADGSWFVGGSFSVFESQNQGRLAKLEPDGTLDTAYLTPGVGFNNTVYKVLPLADNKTMVFGSFTTFNGVSSARIARLQEDGTLDPTFNSSAVDANNIIRSAIIQQDGKIVIAGSFTSYNGVSVNRIARVLSNGAIDPSFSIGTAANNLIYALAMQTDGKIIVVGNFTLFNGAVANRVLRLLPSGALDTSFNVGAGADGIVEAVLVQSDGKIVVGGRFSNFNGSSYNRLARLNSDGSLDSGFSVGVGFDKNVYALAVQSDNKLIVGGIFLNYRGSAAKRVLRLNANGSLDTSFAMGTGLSSGEVRSLLVQADNRILIGGTFSGTYNGTGVKRMARLLRNGVYDTTFSVDLNNTLFSSCFTADNKLIIGGSFNSVSGVSKHRVARIKLCVNSSVWNGSVWDNGLPTVDKTLVFNNDFSGLNTYNACSCVIAAAKTVTTLAGNSLSLIFDYSGAGTLVLENNASLYQSDDEIVNTGTILLKRKTTPIFRSDYTYWSSPVANQSLYNTSPETSSNKFFSFNPSSNNWLVEDPSKIMETGKGYIIRGPESFSTVTRAVYEASFKGIPNNGEKTITLGPVSSFNLIGNPYPSAVNLDVFLIENAAVLKGTVYLWSHNTPITNNVYTSDDYAVYNLLGGVGTNPSKNVGVNNFRPDGKLASGQSFFIAALSAGGTVKFSNKMRVVGQNSNFFKMTSSQKQKEFASVEKHRAWLNMSNASGAFKQMLVGYMTDATDGYDTFLDGTTFTANQYIDFYSICEGKNLVIQAKGLPFNDQDEVALGFKTTVDGNYTIEIDEVDGALKEQQIYIVDKLNNSTHNLKESSYNFSTVKGTFNDRFVLRYTDKTLKTNNVDVIDDDVFVFSKNRQLKINSSIEYIDRVIVYDVSGKQLYQKNNVNSTHLLVSNLQSGRQLLFLSIILQNGRTLLKKVVY